jgi:hypothetical protein
MDCNGIDNLLTAYLEGEVTPEEEGQIKAHLSECSQCRGELESLADSRDRLRRLLKLEASRVGPPPGSWGRIAEKAGIKEGVEKPTARGFGMVWRVVPICIVLLAVLATGFAGVLGASAPPPPEPPMLVGDGEGGAIVVWQDEAYFSGEGVFAQYVDDEGNLLWGENGIQVFDGEDHISKATSDGAGGAVIYWLHDGISYAQRISRDGEILWGDGGIPAGDVSEEFASIPPDSSRELKYNVMAVSVSGESVIIYEDPPFETVGYSRVIDDGSGGVIVASRVGEDSSVSRTYSVYVQRIDADGARLWGDGGLEIHWVASSPVLLIIAGGVILIAAVVLIGVYRRSRAALIFTAIAPVIIGIITVSSLFFTTISDNSCSWAYVTDTPLNQAAIAIMPIAGLIIVAVGDRKRAFSRWVTVPVFIFSLLVTAIVTLALYISIF